jgi:hypothetical protein
MGGPGLMRRTGRTAAGYPNVLYVNGFSKVHFVERVVTDVICVQADHTHGMRNRKEVIAKLSLVVSLKGMANGFAHATGNEIELFAK